MHRTDEDIEISLKDLFFYILSKWKLLIILMVIGAAAAGAYSYYKSEKDARALAQSQTAAYSDDQLYAARAALSDDEAANVESVYRQYQAYLDSQETIGKKFSDSVFWMNSDNKPVMKLTKYCVQSDIQDVAGYFKDMSLGSEEISEIREIIGDSDNIENIDDLVSVSGSSTAYYNLTEDGSGSYKSLVTVSVIAASQDQCDSISEIVDKALGDEIRALQKADPDITLTYVDTNYTDDVEDTVIGKQQEILSSNSSIISSITSLQNNQISQFTDEEKAYYDLLWARDSSSENSETASETAAVSETVSAAPSVSKKYVAAGILGGLVLAVILAIIRYLSDHTIKTSDDITSLYDISVLDQITLSGNKKGSGSREVQTELLASDISITAGKNNLKSCYFAADPADMDLVHEIAARVSAADKNLEIGYGQPLTDIAQLNKLASMDAIVLVVHLKKTQLAALDKTGDLVNRFELKVIGAITIDG